MAEVVRHHTAMPQLLPRDPQVRDPDLAQLKYFLDLDRAKDYHHEDTYEHHKSSRRARKPLLQRFKRHQSGSTEINHSLPLHQRADPTVPFALEKLSLDGRRYFAIIEGGPVTNVGPHTAESHGAIDRKGDEASDDALKESTVHAAATVRGDLKPQQDSTSRHYAEMPREAKKEPFGSLSTPDSIGPAPDRPLPPLPNHPGRQEAVSEAHTAQSLACLEGAIAPPRPPKRNFMEQLSMANAASRSVEHTDNRLVPNKYQSPEQTKDSQIEVLQQGSGSGFRFPRLEELSSTAAEDSLPSTNQSAVMNDISATPPCNEGAQAQPQISPRPTKQDQRRNRTRARKIRDLPLSQKSSRDVVQDEQHNGTAAEGTMEPLENQTKQHDHTVHVLRPSNLPFHQNHAQRKSHGTPSSHPNPPPDQTASTSGVASGDSLMAQSRNSHDVTLRVQALERENRLLQAALEAVLKTNGQVNGCPWVNSVDLSSTSSIEESLEQMRYLLVPNNRSSDTKDMEDSRRTSRHSMGSRHSYNRSGRSPSALDLYLATRSGHSMPVRHSLQAAPRTSLTVEEKADLGGTEAARSQETDHVDYAGNVDEAKAAGKLAC